MQLCSANTQLVHQLGRNKPQFLFQSRSDDTARAAAKRADTVVVTTKKHFFDSLHIECK